MSISQLYPAEGPSLNLNFAGSRTLDPRITFTRTQTTSNGSTYTGRGGLIKYAGPNEPRFDHRYVSGDIESLGLLIEEQRENLLTYSEQFDNAAWAGSQANVTFTANSTTAPDGTNTADLVSNTGQVISLIGSLVTVTASSQADYYVTVYAKKATSSTFTFNCYYVGNAEDNVTFNFDTGVVSGVPNAGEYIFQNVGNGWYRCGFRMTKDSTGTRTTLAFRFWESGRGNTLGNTYFWGAQLEVGAFPTSYIPTEGSTKTRTADNASITGSNFIQIYNQEAGSYKVEGIINSTLPANNYGGVFGAGGGSGTSNFIFLNPSNSFGQYVSNTGQSPASFLGKTYTNGVKFKIGGVYSTNDFACSLNGDISTSTTNNALYKSHTYFRIGGNPISGITGGVLGTMVISNISYYPTRLPNSQLIALTR
jgi:hypothetical protein